MTGDGLLGRAELERAFTALGDRLVRAASSRISSSWAERRWRSLTTPSGFNTKVKFLKRQMYGRAGFALLRQRILLA